VVAVKNRYDGNIMQKQGQW